MRIFIHIFLAFNLLFCFGGVQTSAQSQKKHVENLLLTAVERFNANDFQMAEALLKEIVKVDAENDACWYYLSQISIINKDLELTETYLKKAMGLDPSNFWYRYKLAKLYALTSRQELTIAMYEKLLQDFPKKSDLYFDLAELYAGQQEYEKALETISEIEKVFGITESIAVYRFNILRIMGRQDEAYESLREYNRQYSSPFVLSALADYEMAMYNDSTAVAYYDEALDIAPDYSPALLGKAEALRVTRRYDEYFPVAYSYVESGDSPAEGKSDYLMAIIQRTDPKFIRSFQSQLDTLFTKVVNVHPTDSTVLHTAALYYYSTGRDSDAKKYFGTNVKLYPKSIAARASFVEFLMYTDQWEDLSVEGRAAYDRFPEETGFLEMASVADYNLGEYGKVLDICRKVIEVAPADSSKTLRAWSTMGDVYYRLGDSKKAYKAYDKALKINPDYVYVLNNYAYYLSEEGKNLKKAYNMSRKTVEAEPDNATYLDTFAWILYLQGKPQEAKPYFKHAMLYGGKDSAVILDHYAEVLYALKEYDMAVVYWNMALQKNDGRIPGLAEKVKQRKEALRK